MSILRPSGKKTSRLREAIAVSSAKDHLYNLPEYLAKLIEDFESRDVHPQYREDVYKTLSATVNVCRTVINPTFPAKTAIEEIGLLMTMLPRMLHHLANRPTTTGFAIMIPHTREIFPSVYSTEAEAQAQLRQLQGFSPNIRGAVIPVRLTSEVVTAPVAPKRTIEWPPAAPVLEHDDPIPEGIKPQRQLGFSDLLSRVQAIEGDMDQHIPPLSENAPEGPPAAASAARTEPRAPDESPPTGAGGPGNAIP